MSVNRDAVAEFYDQGTSAIEKDIDVIASASPVESRLTATAQSGEAVERDQRREAIRDGANGVKYTDVAFDIEQSVVLLDLF
jgi:hypothetical protein